MSELQKKTARLIAEAEALLARAQAEVHEARDKLRREGIDPKRIREDAERRLGPQGKAIFEEVVQQRLAMLRAQVARDMPPPQREEGFEPVRRRRPKNIV